MPELIVPFSNTIENMKKNLVCYVLALLCGLTTLSAQSIDPPAPGQFKLNKKRTEMVTYAPVPVRINAKVNKSETDYMEIAVDWKDSYYTSYYYARLQGNIFAQTSNGYFVTPVEDFIILKGNDVMEIYNISESQSEIAEVIVMAKEGSKWKSLKKAANANAESFNVSDMVAAVPAWNSAKKERIAAEEAAKEAERERIAAEKKAAAEKARAEREAKAKAEAEAAAKAREEADLCTPFKGYLKMVSSNFADIKGKIDPEETEMEEEDVFFTTETPPLFTVGRLYPNLFDEKKKELCFDSQQFNTKEGAEKELEFIKSKLASCFNAKTGYKVHEDSGLHFYDGKYNRFFLVTKMDWDTDRYFVRVRLKK